MRLRTLVGTGAVAAAMLALATPAGLAGTSGNVRVTRDAEPGSYVRSDGQADATTQACSTGKRAQNEPTVAVDPRSPSVVVAGSNDYCAAIVNGDVWVGYYRSTDGGAHWTNSLVPGYPQDTSAAGVSSPVHGSCGAAGDPTQSFDGSGRLFYGFICFNRTKPVNGSIFVATYDQDGARYVRTALVDEGTPSGQFSSGLFQDKVNLVVDQTSGPHAGNLYVAWARYAGRAQNNVILFSRSTDHGASFSRPIRISPGLAEEQFADLAVGPDGAVYLTYRTFSHQGPTQDAIFVEKSTDGGMSFSEPQLVATVQPFDSNSFSGNGSESCGDGPLACPSGLTFSRFASLSAVAADANGVHVVWSAELPNGQAKVFVRNSPNGTEWPTPAAPLDSAPRGHQYFPDVGSAGGVITVVFYDSRSDPAYSPLVPPGDTSQGRNSGDVVNTFVARSTDGGKSWVETQVTTAGSNYNWETHGSRRVPFWGDYIYVSAVPGGVYVVWTDSRNLVPGVDQRDPGATDGFDVFTTCGTKSPPASDACLSQGGLDQNIYGERI